MDGLSGTPAGRSINGTAADDDATASATGRERQVGRGTVSSRRSYSPRGILGLLLAPARPPRQLEPPIVGLGTPASGAGGVVNMRPTLPTMSSNRVASALPRQSGRRAQSSSGSKAAAPAGLEPPEPPPPPPTSLPPVAVRPFSLLPLFFLLAACTQPPSAVSGVTESWAHTPRRSTAARAAASSARRRCCKAAERAAPVTRLHGGSRRAKRGRQHGAHACGVRRPPACAGAAIGGQGSEGGAEPVRQHRFAPRSGDGQRGGRHSAARTQGGRARHKQCAWLQKGPRPLRPRAAGRGDVPALTRRRSQAGCTPAICAAYNGSEKSLLALLGAGANIEAVNQARPHLNCALCVAFRSS